MIIVEGKEYPVPVAGKLYIHVYHGRKDPHEQLDDWGFDGPWIGPLVWFGQTYKTWLKLEFETDEAARAFGFAEAHSNELSFFEDLLVLQGNYYGDWEAEVFKG